jgi:hypothetical protein
VGLFLANMKLSKNFWDFNKELFFGEVGTLIGIQFVNLLSESYAFPIRLIPHLVVLGAMIGGSLFWLLARVYYKSKEEKYSEKKFLDDVKYFVPASTFFTFVFYYPVLFFATKYFLEHHRKLEFSTIVPQVIAFCAFIVGINIYRYILLKVEGKNL